MPRRQHRRDAGDRQRVALAEFVSHAVACPALCTTHARPHPPASGGGRHRDSRRRGDESSTALCTAQQTSFEVRERKSRLAREV
eukprot:364298-Chlamydomonas_euryale.AAC.19